MSDEILDVNIVNQVLALYPEGDTESFAELVDLFRNRSVAMIAEGRLKIEAGKPEEAIRPIHSLKSSIASLGGARAQKVCAALEKKLRAGEVAGALEDLQTAEAEIATALAAIAEYIAKPK